MNIRLFIFSALIGATMLPNNALAGMPVVSELNIGKYMGSWYEIAKLPNRFQKQCLSNVTATYTLMDDKSIEVVNRCKTKDGSVSEAKGVARKANEAGSNAKLKVRFAPAWLSWLSSVWGDYWVLDLAPDYSYALVGERSLTYLWVLSRSKTLDDKVYEGLLERAKKLGYNTSKVVRTIQD